MYTNILIRFGELSTKGKNKMSFVRQLEKNIKLLIGANSEVEFDRIFLKYSKDTIMGLKRIFGIQSYSPVVKVRTNEKVINTTILKLVKLAKGKTFKANVKRHFKGYPKKSMEIAANIGELILDNNPQLVVNVKNPEFIIEIEIRQNYTYVFIKRIKGLGGYPTGINGKVLHLISGGIDSPVAAFEMMKRGIHVDYINFITPPFTDEKTIKKVNQIITLLTSYQGKSKLYRNNFTDIMNLIGLTSNQAYKINLMRRSFYRIASKKANRKLYLGISNGENIGQVASQTLESMLTIQSQSTLPIYRPVLTADKLDIITRAIEIGTYNISIKKANETCETFAPILPIIKPTLEASAKLEKNLKEIKQFEKNNYENNFEELNFIFDWKVK